MGALATSLFDYPLPPERIAQTPADRRDGSRLLVVDRARRTLTHRAFSDLPDWLHPADTLFRNNVSVLPARLKAVRPTGGKVECFLLERRGLERPEIWRCLIKPGKKLPVGASFADAAGHFAGEIVAREDEGTALVRFTTREGEPLVGIADRVGEVPLPPYILRPDSRRRASDRESYQTVYADPARPVAVAAPTAGLHFTPELLASLADRGVEFRDLVLHVGLGTFRPIATDTIEAHPIHTEIYELPVAAQRALFPPRAGRRIAVGTTSVRTIEDFLAAHSAPLTHTQTAAASIYLYPPRTFLGVDALITNFHQPRSTLLCLVAAFLTPGCTDGIAWLKEIYAEAIAREYRFLSYGDAMLII